MKTKNEKNDINRSIRALELLSGIVGTISIITLWIGTGGGVACALGFLIAGNWTLFVLGIMTAIGSLVSGALLLVTSKVIFVLIACERHLRVLDAATISRG